MSEEGTQDAQRPGWVIGVAILGIILGAGLIFDFNPLGRVSGQQDGICIPNEGQTSQEAGLETCEANGDCPQGESCEEAVWEASEAKFCVPSCQSDAEQCPDSLTCLQTQSPDESPAASGCGGGQAADPKSDPQALARTEGQAMRESVRKSRLQAHWSFERSDTPGKDETMQHPGTLSGGAVWAQDDTRGGVLQLPTSSSVMTLSSSVMLGESWTITAWFKRLKPNNAWRTLTRGTRVDHQVLIKHSANTLGAYIHGSGGFISGGYETLPIHDDAWHQVAAVGEGNTTTYYIDGERVGSAAAKSRADVIAVGNFQNGTQPFADYIDDVKIYSVAFSADDVLDDHDVGLRRQLAHYTFNSEGDKLGKDSLGQFNATPSGGATLFQDEAGKRGRVLALPNSDARLDLGEGIALQGNWTVAGWFKGLKPNNAPRTLLEMASGDKIAMTNANQNLLGTLAFGGAFASSGFDLSTLATDAWHHVAVVNEQALWRNPVAVSAWSKMPCRGYTAGGKTYYVEAMLDNNAATFWNAAHCGSTRVWEITFDMGSPGTLQAMRMRSLGNGWHDPRHVTVEQCTGADGASCETVTTCARQHGSAAYQSCVFGAAVETRYVKLKINGWGRHGSTFHESGHWQYYISDVQFRDAGGNTTTYIDGQLRGQTQSTFNGQLKAVGNAAGGGEVFAEHIDEFKVFATALDPSGVTFDRDAGMRQATRGAVQRDQNLTGKDLAGADLTGADLGGSNLTDADLAGANMQSGSFVNTNFSGANLTGADLTGADLTGAQMASATLTRIKGHRLRSCPASLPPGWKCINMTLVGPTADLTGVDLSSTDLSGMDLAECASAGLKATTLSACPQRPPSGWQCLNQNLAGPGANLKDAQLDGADMAALSLTGASLDGVRALNLAGCPTALPSAWRCVETAHAKNLVGPKARLSGADLRDADLQGASLDDVDLSGVNLSGARTAALTRCSGVLPSTLKCVWSNNPNGFALVGPGVNLAGVNLMASQLNGADLQGADLQEANLMASEMDSADLRGANLHRADLRGVNAAGARFQGTTLSQAVMRSATFTAATFDAQTILTNADLRYCDLSGLDLSGLDLSSTYLSSWGERTDTMSPGGGAVPNTDFGGVVTLADVTRSTWHHDRSQTFFGGGGVRAIGLVGCPAALPPHWQCPTTPSGKVLAGPLAELHDVDLSGITLENTHMHGLNLKGGALRNAHFVNAAIYGGDLTRVDLSGTTFSRNDETPFFDNTLFDQANFSGIDMASKTFFNFDRRVTNGHMVYLQNGATTNISRLTACPSALPLGWACTTACFDNCMEGVSQPSRETCEAACEPFGQQIAYDIRKDVCYNNATSAQSGDPKDYYKSYGDSVGGASFTFTISIPTLRFDPTATKRFIKTRLRIGGLNVNDFQNNTGWPNTETLRAGLAHHTGVKMVNIQVLSLNNYNDDGALPSYGVEAEVKAFTNDGDGFMRGAAELLKRDCVWAQWGPWSGCTIACNVCLTDPDDPNCDPRGGEQSRVRSVCQTNAYVQGVGSVGAECTGPASETRRGCNIDKRCE